MSGQRHGFDTADIPLAATAVERGVAVEALTPVAPERRAEAVVLPRNGSEVQYDQGHVGRVFRPTNRSDDATLDIVAIDPFKAGGFEIDLVEGRLAEMERVEIAHPPQKAGMKRVLEQVTNQGWCRGSTRSMKSSFLPGKPNC